MRVRSKLLVVLITTTVVACAALGVWVSHLLGRAVRESSIERLEREVTLLSRGMSADLAEAQLHDWASDAGSDLGLRVTVIADDGIVLADSEVGPDSVGNMDNHRDRPEIQAAFRSGQGRSLRTSDTTGDEYFYLARRVSKGGVGYLRLALPSSQLDAFNLRYLLLLLIVIVGGLLLLGILAWIVVGRLARPVEDMTAIAERVASGDLDADVPEVGDDEIFRLARSVNRMKDSLVTKLGELTGERSLLRAMTEGLDEGLLLIDGDHRILLANDAFKRVFRVTVDTTGRRVGEVVRNPVVLEQIDICLAQDDDRREVVSGPAGTNRSFELHVTSVSIPGDTTERGALVLFFDITRQEALEQVRQRFIADVSHELRTPVTSIKGAMETLLDSPGAVADSARRFVEMALRQSDRMTDLIADLADLSRIETGAIELERRELELSAMARDVAAAVASRHSDREVEIQVRIGEGFQVFADARRLEQVLVNLVDNAVKFTPDGGSVSIQADRKGGFDEIRVIDTGCGIPQESIDQVFARFYRVDRARSRDLGGTGLGLAIVKHLMKLHHGAIRVESRDGEGATFIMELPRAAAGASE